MPFKHISESSSHIANSCTRSCWRVALRALVHLCQQKAKGPGQISGHDRERTDGFVAADGDGEDEDDAEGDGTMTMVMIPCFLLLMMVTVIMIMHDCAGRKV